MAEERNDTALYRIVAEFTRENAARDVKLAAMERDMGRVGRVHDELRELRARVESFENEQRRLHAMLDGAAYRRLTDTQMRAVERLAEMVERRGELDLLTEPEMDALRSGLRGIDQWRREHHQILEELAENKRHWEAHQAYLDQRLTAIQENREKLSDVESWKQAMEAQFNDQRQRFYEIELSRLNKEELDRMRTFLRQWAAADPNFEHFVALLNEYIRNRMDRRNWRFWLRQQSLVWIVSALIITPISVVFVLIIQHLAGR